MNFCKFYNKYMNKFDEIDRLYLGDNEKLPRSNIKSVNIFVGIINILLTLVVYSTCGLGIYLSIKIYNILKYFYNLTISKCDREE